jgi:hypothetical protein
MFTNQVAGGPAEYDGFRLTMRADGSDYLLDDHYPGEYHFGPNAIHNITVSPGAPAVLDHGEHVTVSYDYDTDVSGGVQIYVLPYTDGLQTPDCSINGSPLHPVGSGSVTNWFTVDSGDVQVDEIWFVMFDYHDAEIVLEFSIDALHVFGDAGFVLDVEDETPSAAAGLAQNFPNPFNPTTTIVFGMPEAGTARVSVYNLQGRHVVDLFDGPAVQGDNRVVWSGRDARGRAVPSGAYVYRLTAGERVETRRMTLLK